MNGRAAELRVLRRKRRRHASTCFFCAGIGFGTALYLLRARFHDVVTPEKRWAMAALVALMAILVWIGARAEAEVSRIDEELRDIEKR